MDHNTIITKSLELAGETGIDPAPLVYKKLFERSPEIKPQFVLDTDDSAKGQMLFQFFECVLDHIDSDHFSSAFLQSEIVNHEGLGVDREMFMSFFSIVHETLEEVLLDQWTPEMTKAWMSLTDSLRRAVNS